MKIIRKISHHIMVAFIIIAIGFLILLGYFLFEKYQSLDIFDLVVTITLSLIIVYVLIITGFFISSMTYGFSVMVEASYQEIVKNRKKSTTIRKKNCSDSID